MAQTPGSQGGDDFIGVHIAARARARLKHVHGELLVVLTSATSAAAAWMAVARLGAISPNCTLAAAAAPLISPKARMNARGILSPLGGKFWIARCVWAPHSAVPARRARPYCHARRDSLIVLIASSFRRSVVVYCNMHSILSFGDGIRDVYARHGQPLMRSRRSTADMPASSPRSVISSARPD